MAGVILETLLASLAAGASGAGSWRDGVEGELAELAASLENILTLLCRVEQRRLSEAEVGIQRCWEMDVENLCYEVEEELGDMELEYWMPPRKRKRGRRLLQWLVLRFHPHDDRASRIRSLTKKFNKLAEQGVPVAGGGGWGFSAGSSSAGRAEDERWDLLPSRDPDRRRVVELLKDEGLDRQLEDGGVPVIAILGMGGIGKTAVTRAVFDDEAVKDHFGAMAWVDAFGDMALEKLTRSVLQGFGADSSPDDKLRAMQRRLQGILHQKVFLLVLDDLQSEDRHLWEVFRASLAAGATGSRVLVTARSETVASSIRANLSYHLSTLSAKDCWQFFLQQKSGLKGFDSRPDLCSPIKQMLQRYGSSPLAAKDLAYFFPDNIDDIDLDDMNEIFSKFEGGFRPVNSSYDSLPVHQKRCFTYSSVFPIERSFERNELVQLWIAQGLVQPPSSGDKSVEDIGDDYFEELLKRGFFEGTGSRLDQLPTYKIQSSNHCLAQKHIGDRCLWVDHGKPTNTCPVDCRMLHLVISNSTLDDGLFQKLCLDSHLLHHSKNIRTIFMSGSIKCGIDLERITQFIEMLKYLRVLDFSSADIQNLPDSIGTLEHLRYLSLYRTRIKRLPESVGGLCSLETLKLGKCHALVKIPECVSSLTNLRHLDLHVYNDGSASLISKLPRLGRLVNLQTLRTFAVCGRGRCGTEELKHLSHLKQLNISKLENVVSVEDAKKAQLEGKHLLRKLELQWEREISTTFQRRLLDEQVLGCLQPATSVKDLKIEGFSGFTFPLWMATRYLPNLEILTLSNCGSCDCLPRLGELPCLKSLTIGGLHRLPSLNHVFRGDGDAGFPSLQFLHLLDLPEFEEWTGVMPGDYPCLQELRISDCPKLNSTPSHPLVVRKLEIRNCQALICLPTFPNLRDLALEQCHNSIFMLFRELVALSSLTISKFSELNFLPDQFLKTLTALKTLKIIDSENFSSLSESKGSKGLSCLNENLKLLCDNCPKFSKAKPL